MSVDFGKLPQFGGTSLDGLNFNMILGVRFENAKLEKVSFGISGLSAKDITIDLFRVLTLEIDEFFIGKIESVDPDNESATPPKLEDVSAIIAENIRLKILDWSPLPEGAELSLLLLHPNPASSTGSRNQRKGMLLAYDAAATRTTSCVSTGW